MGGAGWWVDVAVEGKNEDCVGVMHAGEYVE